MGLRFRDRRSEEPEINLIPFIDVLLVVLIFLMLSTTYSRFTELKVNLPIADSERSRDYPREIVVTVAADGRYMVNQLPVEGRSVDLLSMALSAQAGDGPKDQRMVIISADATAPHQAVINVMDAARRAGLQQLTFATQRGRDGH